MTKFRTVTQVLENVFLGGQRPRPHPKGRGPSVPQMGPLPVQSDKIWYDNTCGEEVAFRVTTRPLLRGGTPAYHLALNLLLHYLAKRKWSIIHL